MFAIFCAGYALCRIIDEAFRREWWRVAIYGAAMFVLLAIGIGGRA